MKRVVARAPGRVNLIGEHTDYNDGFVLPCAIAYDTRVEAISQNDGIVRVQTSGSRSARFELDGLPAAARKDWTDYVVGVLTRLTRDGVEIPGCSLDVRGNVPIGAGLSSSASFEVALALALLSIAGAEMPRAQIALLAQRAEVEFVGMRCGIMDQFTVLHAEKGHALFLDTRTLRYELIPVPQDAAIVICNTMVKHNLASSAYNERREQCELAVQLLQRRYPDIRALRDLSEQALNVAKDDLPPVVFARARHVVTENARVRETAAALKRRDLPSVGRAMNASHESLRTDYEVSCKELDIMVDIARRFEGTFGARMTGGGFGGCAIALIDAACAPQFRSHIEMNYRQAVGKTPEIYDGTPSAGAFVLDE